MAPIQGWRESLSLLSGWRLSRSKQHQIEEVVIVVLVQPFTTNQVVAVLLHLLLLSGWQLRRSEEHQIDPKPYFFIRGTPGGNDSIKDVF